MQIVIEDRDLPEDERIVGFGISFFSTPEFVGAAKTSLAPFLDERVLEKWKKGRKSWLEAGEVEAVHASEGLTIVALHWGVLAKKYGPEGEMKLMQYLGEQHRADLAKFRIKEYLEEAYGEAEKERLLQLGLQVARDYAEFPNARLDGGERPFLISSAISQTRKLKQSMETLAAKFAVMGPPRFLFRSPDQEVLKLALDDLTDDQIAGRLCLSLPAIKKRWQSIYARVDEIDPQLFQSDDQEQGQRRRKLLALIREHPEELWPAQKEVSGK